MKYGLNVQIGDLNFREATGTVVLPPAPKKVSASRLETYYCWLGSLTERIGEALNPALPGEFLENE